MSSDGDRDPASAHEDNEDDGNAADTGVTGPEELQPGMLMAPRARATREGRAQWKTISYVALTPQSC